MVYYALMPANVTEGWRKCHQVIHQKDEDRRFNPMMLLGKMVRAKLPRTAVDTTIAAVMWNES